MANTIIQFRTAKRHDYKLIRDPDIIADITGRNERNPRPRCGKCNKPTEILRGYDDREVGRWCEDDRLFWRRVEIEKTIRVTEYLPYGSEGYE